MTDAVFTCGCAFLILHQIPAGRSVPLAADIVSEVAICESDRLEPWSGPEHGWVRWGAEQVLFFEGEPLPPHVWLLYVLV